jgi:hypothetical protein
MYQGFPYVEKTLIFFTDGLYHFGFVKNKLLGAFLQEMEYS